MPLQPEPPSGIPNLASHCLTKFQSITELAVKDKQLQVAAPDIEDQNARLRVYIKNVGADREGEAEELFGGSETEKLAEMEDILKHVNKTVTCLMRLSIVIQTSAPHRRYFQSSYHTRIYEPADIKHVAEKHKKAKQELQQRMGKANSYRRQYFKYREDHHYRIAHGSGPDTEGQSTVASSIPKVLDDEALCLDQLRIIHDDAASELASHTTAYDANQLAFPQIPAMSKHGPFE
ncbi:hypothetical protein PG984_009119 [Apiospora sp. TS-2023a]